MGVAEQDSEDIYVWVTRYPDGAVGAVGAYIDGMGHTVLQSRRRAVIEKLRPFARIHATTSGQKVWLRHYRKVQDLEEA